MPPATQRAARLQHLVAWISSSADRVHMKPTAPLTLAYSEITQCRSLTGFPQRPDGCAPPRPPEDPPSHPPALRSCGKRGPFPRFPQPPQRLLRRLLSACHPCGVDKT
jgi:hypothetical protein